MQSDVVDLLTAMSLHMKARGDAGRARAYMRAANAVARAADFDTLVAEDRLRDLRGIGTSIERTILRFLQNGEVPAALDSHPGEVAREAMAAYAAAPFADAPDLHVHTVWSDGTLSVDRMVTYAESLGAPAIGISDHSGSLRIARGLDPESVRAQWAEIDRVQAEHPGIRILKGTECDILRDGSLDHPDDVLAGFDYVIGSLHSHLRLDEREQTARVLAALEHPRLTIWGHPTTRVPGFRPRANLDLPVLFEAAADRGVALEVNGNVGRIDLDTELAGMALAAGCRLSLGSDAHSYPEMLAFAEARRMAAAAGATEGDIVNYAIASGTGAGRAGAPPGDATRMHLSGGGDHPRP